MPKVGVFEPKGKIQTQINKYKQVFGNSNNKRNNKQDIRAAEGWAVASPWPDRLAVLAGYVPLFGWERTPARLVTCAGWIAAGWSVLS